VAEIERVAINIHYKKEQFLTHIKNSPYRNKIDVFEENILQGTARTLFQNRSNFRKSKDFLVIHADNFYTGDIKELIVAHKNRPENCVMTMLLFETPYPQNCGIVELDKNETVVNFHEKVPSPPSNLANGAIYCLSQQALDSLEEHQIDISTDVIPTLIGKIYTVKTQGKIIDIGTPRTYKEANTFAKVIENL